MAFNAFFSKGDLPVLSDEKEKGQSYTDQSIHSGFSLRRTQHKADTLYRADKDFVVFWSNSVNSNLYKADNSIKRTLICGPNGVRFREIPLYKEMALFGINLLF